jgi:hypothetical protein
VIATIELYWIPLGAGQHVVRVSGKTFEALSALVQRRPRCDLYHSALAVTVPAGRYVIEMTPVADGHGATRGVVAEGVVGSRRLGRFRVFRYEVRRWLGGTIPDASDAAAPVTIEVDMACAQSLLDLASSIPTPIWGRDELAADEMWNSNSVTSWLLTRSGVDTRHIGPPSGGRAPGWRAGIVIAERATTGGVSKDGLSSSVDANLVVDVDG